MWFACGRYDVLEQSVAHDSELLIVQQRFIARRMTKLVLLPGMDGTGELFKPLLDALGDRRGAQVISYPTDRALGYEELSTIVRNALPVDEPYVILAESFSGPIAIIMAAEQHRMLKGLILCCTFARNPRPFWRWSSPVLPAAQVPMTLLSLLLLGRFSTASLRTALAKAVAKVSPVVLRQRMRAVMGVDVSAMLRRVTAPCLYLRASQDHVVPANASAHIKTLLPAAQVQQIDAPHCLLQAAPNEAARAISSFMREL